MNLICADTSCWIPYLAGEQGPDVAVLASALKGEAVVMAPVVLVELLSSPELDPETAGAFRSLPLLDVTSGFWERAGRMRSLLLRRRYRPKLADTLIAQACVDYGVPLLTRDRDFRPFAAHVSLRLLTGER